MKVASVNVQDVPDHPIDVVLRYLQRVAMFFGVIGFIGFQEINDKSDKEALRKKFPEKRYSIYYLHTPTPIVVRNNWVVRDQGHITVVEGEKGFTPARGPVWVDAQRRLRSGKFGRMVRFANWHNINGAWNGRFPDTEERRQRIWRQINSVVREVAESARAKGYHFVGVADQNRVNVDKFVPEQVWVQQHGIDKMMAIPAKGYVVRVSAKGKMRKHRPMDHPPIWATIYFAKKS